MYSTVDPDTYDLVTYFRVEAENLWQTEQAHNTVLNMAAAQFLSLSYLGQGKDDAVLNYLAAASNMGYQLGLFGIEDSSQDTIAEISTTQRRAQMYAAWGVFSWTKYIIDRLLQESRSH